MGWVVLDVDCMLMWMGSELCCGWLQCTCCTEHGRYGLSSMQELCGVHELGLYSSACHLHAGECDSLIIMHTCTHRTL